MDGRLTKLKKTLSHVIVDLLSSTGYQRGELDSPPQARMFPCVAHMAETVTDTQQTQQQILLMTTSTLKHLDTHKS